MLLSILIFIGKVIAVLFALYIIFFFIGYFHQKHKQNDSEVVQSDETLQNDLDLVRQVMDEEKHKNE